ncbi:MAG: hypothetical protein QGG42_21555 [Phycisphaerae bacterium]|jgi:hypothetical protein|nr:hypothetical protein [Phycisphaerae bacterium]
MTYIKRYLLKAMLVLAVGVLLVVATGCDYSYTFDYGGDQYIGVSSGYYDYYRTPRRYGYRRYSYRPFRRSGGYSRYGRSRYGGYCD